MQDKFLSIIIPNYNNELYIRECLDSCLKQDISNTDYEIICVDDGSTDKSCEIIKNYLEAFKNLTFIQNEHLGVSVARNTGLKKAVGKYVWFVDADDFIKENCLKVLKETAEKTNADIINFYGQTYPDAFSTKSYFGYVWTHLFKKETVLKNSLRFYENIRYGEDELFYVLLNENPLTVEQLTDIFYFYRQNPNSVMANINTHKWERFYSALDSAIVVKDKLDGGVKNVFFASFLKDRIRLLTSMLLEDDNNEKEVKKAFNKMIDLGLLPCKTLYGYYDKKNIITAKDVKKANSRFVKFFNKVVYKISCIIKKR